MTSLPYALTMSYHYPQICPLHFSFCLTMIAPLILRYDCSNLNFLFVPYHFGSTVSDMFYILSSVNYNLSKNNLSLGSNLPSFSVYYNIEVINNLNIKFIFIATTRTHYLTHNYEDILVPRINGDFHFCIDYDEQAWTWFWNLLKIKSPQQSKPGKIL